MHASNQVDIAFDVRTDARGRDPDGHSATLRRYHRLLWSKPLPDGRQLELDEQLRYSGPYGEGVLRSDAITHTYTNWTSPPPLVAARDQLPAGRLTEFFDLGCTIGGYTIFPTSKRVGGKRQLSINQRRGMHPRIRDRIDLTLECIRRHYRGEASPLEKTLTAHDDFFTLFTDFDGYVGHFLLDDLVDEDKQHVAFLAPFHDFTTDGLPIDSSEVFEQYVDASMAFVRARNKRIDTYARDLLGAVLS